jgi:dTDP-4-dehydrorhamnose reductase
MRILVTGRHGQVARCLAEAGAALGHEMVLTGRPAFDLSRPETIAAVLSGARPQVIVNAAAWTAVDLAESHEAEANLANGIGAGAVAAAAAALGVPIIQLSTDYVFDGSRETPYVETDATGPQSAYGRSKLAGEQAVAAATENHAILRTAWVYDAMGKNFVLTMLRLATTQPALRVVADQIGNPTYAADIAQGILKVAANLVTDPSEKLRGVFHMTAAGETSWAGFATAIFAASQRQGNAGAEVVPIGTPDYPTPARRPANSRLDCSKLARVHDVALADWHDGLERCMQRILSFQTGQST